MLSFLQAASGYNPSLTLRTHALSLLASGMADLEKHCSNPALFYRKDP